MRYALTEREWSIIQPILPNKPRGIPRVDDRRLLNGIFWVLRSGAPWRDLPDFNHIKHCRRIATRYDKLAANYLAFVKLAAIRLWLGVYESKSYWVTTCGSSLYSK